MANSNNWGEIYNSTWWGDKAWSANTLFIDSAPPGFGLNLLKASEDLNTTRDWSQFLISVAANSTDEAAPNATDTAEKLTFTDAPQSRIQQQIALEANTTYTFSVYAKVRTGTKAFRLRNVTLGQAQQFTADTSWGLNPDDGRYSFSFTTGATAITHTLSIQNAASAGTGEVFFWGAMLNEGATAGDYVKTEASVGGSAPAPAYSGFGDSFGGVTAYYSLRQFTEAETLNAIRVRRSSDDTEQDIGFDSNGDLDTTALLAFVGGENKVLQSENLNTTWAKNNATPTASTEETPNGDTTSKFIKLVDNNVGGTGVVFQSQNITLKAATQYAMSAYFKADGVGWVRLQANDYDGSNDARAFFNLSTGAVGTELNLDQSATMTDVGNGWYRCTIVFTMGASDTSVGYVIGLADADNGIIVDLDGTSSIFAWGMMVNQGNSANTYIKTTTGIAGDGAVTTFYDQSGNGNNATNSTESEQPLVVSGGTLVEESGKAALDFDGVSNSFNVSKITLSDDWNLFMTHKLDVNSYYFGDTIGGDYLRYRINDSYRLRIAGVTATVTGIGDITGARKLLNIERDSSNNLEYYLNGTSAATTSISGAWDIDEIGASSTNHFNGTIQELIIFNSDQSSNRTSMETNINDHFSIYP